MASRAVIVRTLVLGLMLALVFLPGAPGIGPSARAATGEAAAQGPPLTQDGIYIFQGCEGEGGCPFRNWRAGRSSPVLEARLPNARVIGVLAPGEWIQVERIETLKFPTRGVVREATERFAAGEVLYDLYYEGEGVSIIWRRGAYASLDPDDPAKIDWDLTPAPPEKAALLGAWVRVLRESGQVGWVRLVDDPDAPTLQFECTGPLAGDPDCRD